MLPLLVSYLYLWSITIPQWSQIQDPAQIMPPFYYKLFYYKITSVWFYNIMISHLSIPCDTLGEMFKLLPILWETFSYPTPHHTHAGVPSARPCSFCKALRVVPLLCTSTHLLQPPVSNTWPAELDGRLHLRGKMLTATKKGKQMLLENMEHGFIWTNNFWRCKRGFQF